jgi:hypothetical protein
MATLQLCVAASAPRPPLWERQALKRLSLFSYGRQLGFAGLSISSQHHPWF